MAGSFLDTTVIMDIADKIVPGKARAEAYITANRPAEAPYYALKELLAGHVQILCDSHNLKRELLQSLALRVTGLWRRAHNLNGVGMVQFLGCFNDGKISYGLSGESRGPRDSCNCIKPERCAAAAYLYDNKNYLKKMIDALHWRSSGPAGGLR